MRAILRPGEKGAWPEVRDRLNVLLQGWSAYFCYGTTQIAYRAVERNVYGRVRRFLVCRHKVRSRGIQRCPSGRVFGELGVLLPRPKLRTSGLMSRDRKRSEFTTAPVLDSTGRARLGPYFRLLRICSTFVIPCLAKSNFLLIINLILINCSFWSSLFFMSKS